MYASSPGSLYGSVLVTRYLELVKLRGDSSSLQDQWPFIQAAVLLDLAELRHSCDSCDLATAAMFLHPRSVATAAEL